VVVVVDVAVVATKTAELIWKNKPVTFVSMRAQNKPASAIKKILIRFFPVPCVYRLLLTRRNGRYPAPIGNRVSPVKEGKCTPV